MDGEMMIYEENSNNMSRPAEAIKEGADFKSLSSAAPAFVSFVTFFEGINKSRCQAYIISAKWFKQWKSYVGLGKNPPLGQKPGEISNADLLLDPATFYSAETSDPTEEIYNTPLKPELRRKVDYKILTEAQWQFLHQRYGGKQIKRKTCYKEKSKSSQTEVYFAQINIAVPPFRAPPKPVFCGGKDLVSYLKTRIKKALGVSGEIRLWKLDPRTGFENFSDHFRNKGIGDSFPGFCLEDFQTRPVKKCNLAPTDVIIVEIAAENGEFPFGSVKSLDAGGQKSPAKSGKCAFCDKEGELTITCACKTVFYCSELCRKGHKRYHMEECKEEGEGEKALVRSEGSRMGIAGLQNLGNTCFMNSGIQCLSNTAPLAQYFLTGTFLKDINESNPLGYKGKIAKSFATLLSHLWYGTDSMYSPWDFKKLIGKLHPSFSGFSQQDVHEFITYLLDGLHEDLKSCSVSLISAMEKSCIKHSTSMISDLFHGQYKSEITCLSCGTISTTYDPFSSLALPLQRQDLIKLEICYFSDQISAVGKAFSATLTRAQTVGDLKAALLKAAGKDAGNLELVAVSNETVDCLFSETQTVEEVGGFLKARKAKGYAFETAKGKVPAILTMYKEYPKAKSDLKLKKDRLGFSRVIGVDPECTLAEFRKHVEDKYVRPLFETKGVPKYELTVVSRKMKDGRCAYCGGEKCRDCMKMGEGAGKVKDLIKGDDGGYSPLIATDSFGKPCVMPALQFDLLFLTSDPSAPKPTMTALARFESGDYPVFAIKAPALNLDQCLSLLAEPETLEGGNAWVCPKCAKPVKAVKRLAISGLPPILVIQLKRFKNAAFGIKDDSLVKFPLTDMGKHLEGISHTGETAENAYDLYAVSNHYGGMGFGHYTAFALNPNDGKWYKYDDATAREMSETEVCTSAAYLLFYRKRSRSS